MASNSFPLTKIDYVSKDFLTLREELLQKLPIITNGKWSDLSESDPGIAMLEVFMSMVDNLLFYQDQMSNEVYLPTARQRNNVIKLLRLVGYEFNSVTASEGFVSFSVAAGTFPVFPVSVKAGTQFSAQSNTTNKTIIFTSQQDATLLSSTDSKTVPVIQGISTTETFSSDGSPTQKFTMSNTSVDKNTVVVSVSASALDNTVTTVWTPVPSFYASVFNDTHYQVQIDEFSRVSIIFGDGQFGKIPPVDTNIIVNYIVTDAANGNVGKNAITSILSSVPLVQDNAGASVQLSILNSLATAGGSDIENIEHAKQTAIGLLFGLRRALSRDDFAALMTSVAGVDKAIAWGENEESNPDYRLVNKVRVSFLSKVFLDMYFNPSSRASYRTLRDNNVKPLLLQRIPITTRIAFIDPIIIDVFMSINININTGKFDPNIVLDQVKTNLLNFYSFDNISFGQDVRISDIMTIVQQTPGVGFANLIRLSKTPASSIPDDAPQPPIDVLINKWEIPTLVDTNISPNTQAGTAFSTPYLQVKIPVSSQVGFNDVIVINPDTQSDALVNSFTFYPSPNDKHIILTFSAGIHDSSFAGGFYGDPQPESDSPIYTSSQ